MKKSEIPVTSIELIISPDRASQTTEAITFTAKVSLRDKTITPVGQVIFESKNFGTLIDRKDLVKGEAKTNIPRMGKGKQFFRNIPADAAGERSRTVRYRFHPAHGVRQDQGTGIQRVL